MGRPRSCPLVSGTMQKLQRMLHPCMMDTKAEGFFPAAT